MFQRMRLTFAKAAALFLTADAEPKLDQMDATVHQVPLELRHLAHELVILAVAAKAHDALDTGAVVPRAVEQNDLASGGQVGDKALEVPLAALGPAALFAGFACTLLVLTAFILWRLRLRDSAVDGRVVFMPMLRTTPSVLELVPEVDAETATGQEK